MLDNLQIISSVIIGFIAGYITHKIQGGKNGK